MFFEAHPSFRNGNALYVAFGISFLTFSIYIGSAIYTSSIPAFRWLVELNLLLIMPQHRPHVLSPLQELPILGRNPVYIAFLFVIFQIPIVTATNMSTVLAMRSMTGSPALATG